MASVRPEPTRGFPAGRAPEGSAGGTAPGFPRGPAAATSPVRSVALSLLGLSVVALVIGAWGGIAPYVGPAFGYSADGSGSWHWTLSHALLGLVPGAVAVAVAMAFVPLAARAGRGRGRVLLWLSGLACLLCGAWFVVGPAAWPVLTDASRYFVPAAPLQALGNVVGYSLGPGVVLAACGAFAMGWAVRHRRDAVAVQPVAAGTGVGQAVTSGEQAATAGHVTVGPSARHARNRRWFGRRREKPQMPAF